MKIIHVAESFSAGILDFICYLTTELSHFNHTIIYGDREINERNIQIEEIKKRFPTGVTFIQWPNSGREVNPFRDIPAFFALRSLLKSQAYDCIHLHSSKAGFIGRAVGFFLKNKNIIYTPHSAYFLRTDISVFKKKCIVMLERMANAMCGEVVCCSKSEQQQFLRYNIPATYINNGIPLKPFTPPLQSNASRFTIAASGRSFHQKNPKLFNEIAKKFEDNANIRFLWIGDGYLNHQLTASNINVTGWVTREKVYEYLDTIDVYLSTSLWEGLPYSVLDAMSIGKPLVLSACIGNVDLVRNEFNGFLFHNADEAAEKIKYLYAHRDVLNQFGLNSRRLCEESFDLKKTSRKYEVLYTSK